MITTGLFNKICHTYQIFTYCRNQERKDEYAFSGCGLCIGSIGWWRGGRLAKDIWNWQRDYLFISAMIRTLRNINHINRCLLLKSTSTCATDYSEVDTCKKSRWHDFTSGVYTTTTFTWLSISKVQLHGNDLCGFQIQWFSVLREIEARPDDASLTAMFLTRLRKHLSLMQT